MKEFIYISFCILSNSILQAADFSAFSAKQWVGKMEEIKSVPKSLSNEINLFKNMQTGATSFIDKTTDNFIDKKNSISAPMDIIENIIPNKMMQDMIPEMSIKKITLKELEEKFINENMEKRTFASLDTTKSNNSFIPQPIVKDLKQEIVVDDSMHIHVVYLTPANAPSFSPTLLGKTQEKATRSIINKIDEKWLTEDTPFNEDKGHDHSKCVRIANGYYAGFYNNEEYGPHLKGHIEAKAMWGKNWGGAWNEVGAANAVIENRRILFVIDISNSMNSSDPFDSKNNCQRRLAIKQTITKNSEGVDYGLLYYHEKEKAYQNFISYTNASKKIYDSLNYHACRGEGGTDMIKSAEEAKIKFNANKPYDTIVLITDQSYQDTQLEEIRMKSKGLKVVTSRDKLFDVLDHLIRL